MLACLSGQGVRYELEAEKVLIGRSSDCEISIDAKGISRKHALLELRPGRAGEAGAGVVEPGQPLTAYVTDLGSVNGTFLNGIRLKPNEPHPLNSGDALVFSAYEKKEYKFNCNIEFSPTIFRD